MSFCGWFDPPRSKFHFYPDITIRDIVWNILLDINLLKYTAKETRCGVHKTRCIGVNTYTGDAVPSYMKLQKSGAADFELQVGEGLQ